MFMTPSNIPTEPIWTAFIASAAELTLRKRIPPTQPTPKKLLPKIMPDKKELESTCWKHEGKLMPFGVHPRVSYSGGYLLCSFETLQTSNGCICFCRERAFVREHKDR